MRYFSSLPDHKAPGFNERLHFEGFRHHNIVFNALARKSQCDSHVGCLSIKTVITGEETYEFNGLTKSVRPGQFLVLNNDQEYSSRIESAAKVRTLSVFFTKHFASEILRDVSQSEEGALSMPFDGAVYSPEFFQTLYPVEGAIRDRLGKLVSDLEQEASYTNADEQLMFLLNDLLHIHHGAVKRSNNVKAIKPATRKEIYKRLCVAKDILHSTFMSEVELSTVSKMASMSVPQLIRQFKAVFNATPHQYLTRIRLGHAASLLKHSVQPVTDIALICGYQNTSAFCRSFKVAYGVAPLVFRAASN